MVNEAIREEEEYSYRIKSPGEGIYRIHLADKAGDHWVEAFFTGLEDEQEILLSPGEYVGIVTEVGTGDLSSQISLSVPDPLTNEGPLELAPLVFPDANVAETAANRRQPTFETLLDQRVSRLKSQPAKMQPVVAHVVAAREFRRAFDIGISEDIAPGSIGGWRPPEDLNVAVTQSGETSLQIVLSDRKEDRKSRMRMSVSVANLPAIRVPLPVYRQGVTISIHAGEEAEADLAVEISANDAKVQGLVSALSELPAPEALSVLSWSADGQMDNAIEHLAHKTRDLWAATAAALLLIKSNAFQEYAQWFRNLALLAPHIPDAGIAAAWVELAEVQSSAQVVETKALNHLKRAGRTGAPVFAVANSLNLELLSSLRSTAMTPKLRNAAAREYARATKRSRFRIFRSPYMIWEQSREKLMGGHLDTRLYRSVARGTLGSNNIQLV